MTRVRSLPAGIGTVVLAFALVYVGLAGLAGSAMFGNPAAAQEDGVVPGGALGSSSDADFWRAIRQGTQGAVTIPDSRAGVLIQSEGDNWRAVRNGPLSVFGAWAMLGVIALLALFFALRGRVRIEHGRSRTTIRRFTAFERFVHWLTALSFIVLAISGLNILYGRYVLRPLIGPEAFSAITRFGKYLHNYLAFAFMIGVVLIFVLWVRHNLPSRDDLVWVAKGGGLFTKGTHPPARKFNFGQKIVFWGVVLGGISISLSGISLLWPFHIPLWEKTFAVLNLVGFDLPAEVSALQEMQLSQLWHAVVGLLLIALIIGHIYIGTIGMEGAFDAMGTGKVDRNWAREHHSLWVAEVDRKADAGDD